MFCSNCGAEVKEGTKFCENCGQPVVKPSEAPKPERPIYIPVPKQEAEQTKKEQPAEDQPIFEPEPEPVVPEENRPLGPWGYFGFGLLFMIPVIGLILLIIFSFAGKNVNRKNFARSYWCWAIFIFALALIGAIVLMTGVLRGVLGGLAEWLNSIGFNWLAKLIA